MKIETSDIVMTPDLVLVKLYKPRYKKVKQTVLDDEKNKGKDPKKDIMSLKTVENKVMYNYQTAEIIAIHSDNRHRYEVGEIIIIDYRKIKDFDMFKNVSMVFIYDIIGKVNQTII